MNILFQRVHFTLSEYDSTFFFERVIFEIFEFEVGLFLIFCFLKGWKNCNLFMNKNNATFKKSVFFL